MTPSQNPLKHALKHIFHPKIWMIVRKCFIFAPRFSKMSADYQCVIGNIPGKNHCQATVSDSIN